MLHWDARDCTLCAALRAARRGDWGWIVDASWNLQFITDEQRLSLAYDVEMVPVVIGEHLFGPESTTTSTNWRTEAGQLHETWSTFFANVGDMMLADTPGGKDELRSVVDPSLAAMVDDLSASSHTSATTGTSLAAGTRDRGATLRQKTLRIRDAEGRLRGTAITFQPAVGMNVLGTMALERDPGHLERMRSVASARRRPAAILFADLEGSSALSRMLSTSNYFAAGRRIVRATDRCVVDAGGLVGRHVGDKPARFPVGQREGTLGSSPGVTLGCEFVRSRGQTSDVERHPVVLASYGERIIDRHLAIDTNCDRDKILVEALIRDPQPDLASVDLVLWCSDTSGTQTSNARLSPRNTRWSARR